MPSCLNHSRLVEIEPQVETKPAREPVPPLSGSFFPGVAAEPDNSFVYSLEDRGSIFHWGRSFILIALLGCVAAAASYWYRDLRDVAARLSQRESTPPVPIVRPATGMTTPNNRMPADHKIRSVADGIRDKPLPKPSAGIPLTLCLGRRGTVCASFPVFDEGPAAHASSRAITISMQAAPYEPVRSPLPLHLRSMSCRESHFTTPKTRRNVMRRT